jgi:mono/diheme cytochrome c family protein
MGGRIVARLGCIGCHTLPDRDPATPDPRGRIPWRNIKAKFQPDALIAFLKKPEEHFAWIRMPNFHFSDDEARNVAAYLLKNSKDLDGETPNGDAANGQKLVQSAGCLSCHTIAGQNELKAPAISDLAKGCLAKDATARGKAPDFGLDEPTRDALVAFISTDRASLKQDTPPEFAERQISELGCVNCHSRDRTPDAWDDLVKETESLSKGDIVDIESSAGGKGLPGEPAPGTGDQQRPPLTWVGEKLKPNWMADFIAGKIDYKPRAWMRARMPSFPARAQGITIGLALEHAVPTTLPPEKPANVELAKIGKQLVSRNGGLSCVQCHGIGSIGPIAPFEAPSINFKYVNERLRKDYFDRWMRDPIRLVSTTKMPKFQNDGKTALTDILDGDADKQFDAIWEYLKAGRKIVHPEQQ